MMNAAQRVCRLNAGNNYAAVSRRSVARTCAFLAGLAGIVSLVTLVGCTSRTCFPAQCDLDHPPMGLPHRVEKDPTLALIPQVGAVADPVTVSDPDRPPRFISLQEAFAMALENGTVGLQSLANSGNVSQDLLSFGGQGVFGSDAVRVLAMTPAVSAAQLESTLARFDPVWSTNMNWRKNDQPTQGFSSFNNGAFASFQTSLAKPLSTGGVAGVTFSTDYQLLSTPPGGAFSVLNPSYTPRLTFGIEQPLLRGFGSEINQLLPSFPGSSLFPGLGSRVGAFSNEGILITRIRFDQQRADFERSIHFLILNVESAYWRFYGSYVDLYAAEQGLRQAHAAWTIGKAKDDVGGINPAQFALLRAQFEQFRAERMSALGRVIDNERNLRILLGMQVEDGSRLVPVDAPSLTPYQPHWQTALQDCLTLRPELIVARKDVEARHKQMLVQKNSLLPDLRLTADYSSLGLGTRLDGTADAGDAFGNSVPSNALRTLTGNHFNNWTVGLNLNVPLGYRAENAGVRQARLQLGQAYFTLKDQERRAENTLARQYSRVIEFYKLIEIRRLAREALAKQLEVRFREFDTGAANSTLEFLLEAQRQWALATSQEYQAIVNYNIALASFEFARGTILNHNKVVISEGPLPYCADVRAVEHEQEKTKALVLRERECPPLAEYVTPSRYPLPTWPLASAPSVPNLLSNSGDLPLKLDAPVVGPGLGLKTRTKTPSHEPTTPVNVKLPAGEPSLQPA